MLELIPAAIGDVFQLQNFIAMFFGVALGITIGAIPGLGYTMALALLLPVTFGMSATTAMLLLVGIYCGGVYGGSITAILIRTPGTAASAATVEDGYALAKQGKASHALSMAIYASVFGALISGVILLFASPQIASFALRFGPPEYFMLTLFGLTIISSISGKALSKAFIMASLGILFSTVGTDLVTGSNRFTFGTSYLAAGIDLIPAIIGLYAIAEIFNQAEKKTGKISTNTEFKSERFTWRNLIPFRKTLMRSSLIGVFVGAIPGTGATIATFIGYNEARRASKKPEEFGKGSMEGVAAAESANNATTGTTLIPMMTLGIPGDSGTAILLGALIMQGLVPGPQLFERSGDVVYAIMVGFIIINIFMFIQGKFAVRLFAKITTIPSYILFPVVLGFCLVGAYAVNNTITYVWIALFFGLIGYILPKYGFPVTPLLIGLILGPLAEEALRQSLIISQGSGLIFFSSPIAIFFFLLSLLSVFLPVIQKKWKQRRLAK